MSELGHKGLADEYYVQYNTEYIPYSTYCCWLPVSPFKIDRPYLPTTDDNPGKMSRASFN